MARPRVILGLLCAATTANALLAPAVAPRRAVPLNVIETESSTDEKEIFSETTSISGALAELWSILANPPPPGDFRAMYFPNCEGLKRPQTFQALFEHLEVCKDSSQNFGAHIHARVGVETNQWPSSPSSRRGCRENVALMAWGLTRSIVCTTRTSDLIAHRRCRVRQILSS